jgi:RNA polymerase sigma-70 factor (ECF subfamily)
VRAPIAIDVFEALENARAAKVHRHPSIDRLDDAALVERARAGDAWAEEALYRRHVSHVFGIAARLLKSRVDAEDVVQDTFAIVLEQLASLRDASAVRGWLVQITISQVRRRFRRRRLRRLLGLDTDVDRNTLESVAAPGADPEVRAELACLDRALERLPTEQRIAWMLRYVEGETLEAVAHACNCSLATAKRRLAAADATVRSDAILAEVAS